MTPRPAAVLALVLACGCGRLGFGSDGDDAVAIDAEVADAPPGAIDAAPDGAPACSWHLIAGLTMLPSGPLSLGAAATTSGFTLTFVPEAGGDMAGVNLDANLVPDADWRMTSVGPYVGTSNVFTGSLMTTMVATTPRTFIRRYVANLSANAQTDTQIGNGATPGYAAVADNWYYAVNEDAGLYISAMAPNGTPLTANTTLIQGPAAGLPGGASISGDDADLLAVWGHGSASTCYTAVVTPSDVLPALFGTVPGLCKLPRIAAGGGGTGIAVFQQSTAVKTLTVTPVGNSAAATTIGGGTQPRIVHADSGYWIAWLGPTDVRAVHKPTTDDAAIPLVLGPAPGTTVTAIELAVRTQRPYLFIVAGGQLYWSRLDSCN